MKVLHVTEAMASGILTVIESFARTQMRTGAEVSVAYLRRPESPASRSIDQMLAVNGTALDLGSSNRRILSYFRLAKCIFQALHHDTYDVVHLHSAKAGFLGRVIAFVIRRGDRVVYSPHGFPFLKLDITKSARGVVRRVEAALASIGMLMVTSESELDIAQKTLGCTKVSLVRTGMPPEYFASLPIHQHDGNRPPIVGMVGRITYQKAPWTFSAVAKEIGNKAKFVWVGDGDAALRKMWLEDAGIEVTGWVSSDELARFFDRCDILLFPTLWEGMSLSLIQAQAHGVPAVVSDVVGNRDAVKNGVTGFVCRSTEDLTASTNLLIQDLRLRKRMSHAASAWARTHHSDASLGEESIAAYRILGD